jgi:hypothetical protein
MDPTSIVWYMSKRSIGDLSEVEDAISRVSSELEDERERRAVRLCQYSAIEDDLRRRFIHAEKSYILTSRHLYTGSNRKTTQQSIPNSDSLQSSRYYEQVMDRLQSKTKLFPGIVVRQQADLCRAMHRMELLEKELDHVKDWHVATIRILSQQQKVVLEEKQQMEMNFMNQICATEQECKLLHDKFESLREWKSNVQEKLQIPQEPLSTSSTELDDLSDVDEEISVNDQMSMQEGRQRVPWRTILCRKISKSSLFPPALSPKVHYLRQTSESSSNAGRKVHNSAPHLVLPSQPRSIRRFQSEDRERIMELLS